MLVVLCVCGVFFKQKTAYELRISDWSSDVCSSDLQQKTPSSRGFFTAESRLFGRGSRFGTIHQFHKCHGCAVASTETHFQNADVTTRALFVRSEERRVGNECVSTCKYRW